jgi:hypothetical protein
MEICVFNEKRKTGFASGHRFQGAVPHTEKKKIFFLVENSIVISCTFEYQVALAFCCHREKHKPSERRLLYSFKSLIAIR